MELWSPHWWMCWCPSYLRRKNGVLILLVLRENMSSLSPRCAGLDQRSTVKCVVCAWWGRLVCDLYVWKILPQAQNTYEETITAPSERQGCKKFPWTCHSNCVNSISSVLQRSEGFPFFLPVDLACLKWIQFIRPLIFNDISRSHWEIWFWDPLLRKL